MAGELYLRYWHGRRRTVPIVSTVQPPPPATTIAAVAARRRPDPPYRWADHAPVAQWRNPRRWRTPTETKPPVVSQVITRRPPWKVQHFLPNEHGAIAVGRADWNPRRFMPRPETKNVPSVPVVPALERKIRRAPWKYETPDPFYQLWAKGRRPCPFWSTITRQHQIASRRMGRRRLWRWEHFAPVDFWINPQQMPPITADGPTVPPEPEDFIPTFDVHRRRAASDPATLTRRADREPTPGIS